MACNHNCSSCGEKDCKDRNDFSLTAKEGTSFKKMYAVVSGKGGVGKSLVTSLLAVASNNAGLKTAVIDADITGPSIPKTFGLGENDRAQGSEDGLFPVVTKKGVKVMSMNLLLEEDTMPVIWRGPVISGVVKQFYTDVLWGENDIAFIDMPPGTGDVPLTVFQSLPINGIIIVTTPQDLVGMIVEKAVNMARMMNIPVVGIIENMSYVKCPTCNDKIYVFGKGKTESKAKELGLNLLAQIPIDMKTRELVDAGEIECADVSSLNGIIDILKGE
jgi:Mrp family chromosome partitioning ATPase